MDKLVNFVAERVTQHVRREYRIDNPILGGNYIVGEDGSVRFRVFFETDQIRRFFIHDEIPYFVRGVPQGFRGYANFLRVGNKLVYLDDGILVFDVDGQKVFVELVPHKVVIPKFRKVQ